MNLYFVPFDKDNTVQLKITYQLLADKFYSKREIALQNITLQKNWLQAFVSGEGEIGNISLFTDGPLYEHAGKQQYIIDLQ